MRLFTTILFILIIDFYVFFSLRSLHFQMATWLKYTLALLYWLIPAIVILWISSDWFDSLLGDNVRTYLRAFLLMAYVSKMVAIIPLLVDNLWTLGKWIYLRIQSESVHDSSRSAFLRNSAMIIGSIPFATLTYGMIRNPYRYRLHEKEIGIKGLPESLDGFRIVQISDIHAGSFAFSEPVENAVRMINDQGADIVVFTGDIVNVKAEEMLPLIDIFKKVSARKGVYSVLGNHDYGEYHKWETAEEKLENFRQICKLHDTLGWNLLRNDAVILEQNGATIGIIGVENYSAHRHFPRKGDLPLAYEKAAAADVKILLSHDPSHWEFEVVKDFSDISLMMSGHTHGFQFGVEIPGIIKWSPSQYMYKQWAGLYQSGKQYLYVNRGLGFLGYPGRVGILPEITMLKLRRDEA